MSLAEAAAILAVLVGVAVIGSLAVGALVRSWRVGLTVFGGTVGAGAAVTALVHVGLGIAS